MKQEDVNIEVVSIDDLIQDDHNFNKGNEQATRVTSRVRSCWSAASANVARVALC